VALKFPPQPSLTRRGTRRSAETRLKIGYLSSDLRDHAVSQLLAGVFESQRGHFETFAFSTGPNDGSELRRRMENAFNHFLDVGPMSDQQIATLMHKHSIDIAVDLTGHSQGGRTGVLSFRPAPLQVGFLGFPGTCGASFIDYLITDPYVVPEASSLHYAEQMIYLPNTYIPTDGAPRNLGLPQRTAAGLPAGGFVFCSFNAPYKISPQMFDVWMRILQAVPDSVLWLQSSSATAHGNLAREAHNRGIDPTRLIYASPTQTHSEHFARLSLADLFLDTYPYNAHMTAVEALSVGVPVVTLSGQSFASRVAGSLLQTCGMGQLAVDTPTEYEQLAIALAQDPSAAAALRKQLYDARGTSPLFDTSSFTAHLQAGFTEIWARHERGESPSTLWVEPSRKG
jgi:predicted O-linked N-acetylglucosamine transferase (SPINDLY family)